MHSTWTQWLAVGLIPMLIGQPFLTQAGESASPESPPAPASGADASSETSQKFGTQEGALTGGDAPPIGSIPALPEPNQVGTVHGITTQVGRAGGFAYAYPLSVLPGRGVQPQLALSYSSDARQDSWVGFGWQFQLGSIHRTGWRGAPIPPGGPLSSDERYVLNLWGASHELVPDSSAPGTFRTRHDTNWRVTAQGNTFDHWIAEAPSGHKYYYSSTFSFEQGIQRNTQLLTKIVSPDQKDTLTITYATGVGTPFGAIFGQRALYPQEITYSCGDSGQCHRVAFTWEARPDPIITAASGQLTVWTQRLQKITMVAPDGAAAWVHWFDYATQEHNGRTMLHAIRYTNGVGETLVPPITFTYQVNEPKKFSYVVSDETQLMPFAYTLDGSGFPNHPAKPERFTVDGGALLTDVNDDGLPDQVTRFYTRFPAGEEPSSYAFQYLNHGEGNFTAVSPDIAPGYPPQGFWLSTVATKKVGSESTGGVPYFLLEPHTANYHVADANGDSRLDIVTAGVPWAGSPQAGILSLSGAPQPNAPALPFDPDYVADVNGDGYADLIRLATTNQWNIGYEPAPVYLYDHTANAYINSPTWALPEGAVTGVVGGRKNLLFVDVNRDGLVDILKSDASDGGNGIYLNTAAGWMVVDLSIPKYFFDKHGSTGAELADLNADGFHELVGGYDDLTQYGMATGAFTVRNWPSASSRVRIHSWSYMTYVTLDTGVRYVDLNGDGLLDIVSNRGPLESAYSAPANATDIYWSPYLLVSDILISITHSLGATTKISYRPWAKFGEPIGSPRLVVERVETESNPQLHDDWHVEEYAFAEPDFISPSHADYDPARGPEFLGFRRVEQTTIAYRPAGAEEVPIQELEESRRRTTTRYAAGVAMDGAPVETATAISANHGASWDTLSTSTFDYHIDPEYPGVSLVPPYRVLLHRKTTTNTEGGVSESMQSVYDGHDAWGNVTSEWHTGRPLKGDELKVGRTYESNAAAWTIGFPTQVKVEQNGQSVTHDYTYDDAHRLAQQTIHASGVEDPILTTFDYDTHGNVWHVAHSGPTAQHPLLTTTYEYDTVVHQFPTRITDPQGRITELRYHGIQNPLGAGKGLFGQIAEAYSPATSQFAATTKQVTVYDSFGRVAEQTHFDLAQSQMLTQQTYFYEVVAAKGLYSVTTTGKIAGGPPAIKHESIRTTDAAGRARLVLTAGEQGWRKAQYEYGPYHTLRRSQVSDMQGAHALEETFTVDAVGRLTHRQTPTQSLAYHYTPFVAYLSDGGGQLQLTETDGMGRPVRLRGRGGAERRYAYAVNATQPSIIETDPDGHATQIFQDGLGRTTKRIDPDRGTWTWTYNLMGLVTHVTDARGVVTTYAYDGHGEMQSIDYSQDGVLDVTFQYEPAAAADIGHPTKMTDATGLTEWQYNGLGLVKRLTKQIQSTTYRAELFYDGAGRPWKTRYLGDRQWQQTPYFEWTTRFGLDGLEATYYQPEGVAQVKTTVADIAHDSLGRPEAIFYGNSLVQQMTYDTAGRLATRHIKNPSGIALLDRTYTYATAQPGHWQSVTDTAQPSTSQTATYDEHGRVEMSQIGVTDESFFYATPGGNLENRGHMWTLLYTDATHPHAVTLVQHAKQQTSFGLQYDANGNATKYQQAQMIYSPANQLEQLMAPDISMRWHYDGVGSVVQEQETITAPVGLVPTLPPTVTPPAVTPPNGAATTAAPPSARAQPTARAAGRDTKRLTRPPPPTRRPPPSPPPRTTSRTRVFPLPGVIVETGDGGAVTHFMIPTPGLATAVYSRQGNNATLTYRVSDERGSIQQLIDDKGKPLVTKGTAPSVQTYDAFGLDLTAAPLADPLQQGYVGMHRLGTSGLYRAGPRLYAPTLGRFLQPDPLPGGNPYSYAYNNPIMAHDASGFEPEYMQIQDSAGGGSGNSGGIIGAIVGGIGCLFTACWNNSGGDSGDNSDNPYSEVNYSGDINPMARGADAQQVASAGDQSALVNTFNDVTNAMHLMGMGSPEVPGAAWTRDQARLPMLDHHTYFGGKAFTAEDFPTVIQSDFAMNWARALGIISETTKGMHIGYAPPGLPVRGTIYFGQDAGLGTASHELGHHIEDHGGLNRSGLLSTEFVATLYAAWSLNGAGIYDVDSAIGYHKVYEYRLALSNAIQKCGGDLFGCAGFQAAIAEGDPDWFVDQDGLDNMDPYRLTSH